MQEQVVYLTYMDESVEVYDIYTGEFLRRYDNLSGMVQEIEEYRRISDSFILSTYSTLYEVPCYDAQSLISLVQ